MIKKTKAVDDLICLKSFGVNFTETMADAFQSKDASMRYLASADWRQRCTAIEVLVRHWRLKSLEFQEVFGRLLTDSNESVRLFTILLLGNVSDKVTLQWANRQLLLVSSNPSRSARERDVAANAISLEAHRNFKGTANQLVDDTNRLIEMWNRFEENRFGN